MPLPVHPLDVGELTHAFWRTPELVLYLLRFLSLLQVYKLAAVSRRCNGVCKTYMKGRISRYASPFFTRVDRIDAHSTQNVLLPFFHLLEESRSWIVGSVALASLSILSDPPHPDNLNVITLHLELARWLAFFSRLGFACKRNVPASGAYQDAGRRYLTFKHPKIPGLSITITTAYASHLGHLFFAAPNTDQKVAIGAYHLVNPYLRAVSEQRHITGLRPVTLRYPVAHTIPHHTYRNYARFPGATTLNRSNADLGSPCGFLCTRGWRSVINLTGISRFRWGGMDGLDDRADKMLQDVERSGMKFRLGVKCDNPKCKPPRSVAVDVPLRNLS